MKITSIIKLLGGQRALLLLGQVLLFASIFPVAAFARPIQGDRSLPRPSRVQIGREKGRPKFSITGGTRKGQNHFHSFEQFSITDRGTASFENINPKVKNVFARITGDKASIIKGSFELLTPSQNLSHANFFLLNSNGIRFQGGASIEKIRGSFIASSAQQINFADGTRFSTTLNRASLLSASQPQGFTTGASPKSITLTDVDSRFDIPNVFRPQPGQSLLLIGGNIRMNNSNLSATDSRIGLFSLASNETVRYIDQSTPRLAVDRTVKHSDIALSNSSSISLSSFGQSPRLGIELVGQRIALDNSAILVRGRASRAQTELNPGISLNGTQVSLQQESSLQSLSEPGSSQAFPISVSADRVEVLDTSFIYSSNQGDVTGGPISIQAKDFTIDCLSVIANCAIVITDSMHSGRAGDITIAAHRMRLLNGGQVLSIVREAGMNSPGNIRVESQDLLIQGGFVFNDNWRASGILHENQSSVVNLQSSGTGIQIDSEHLTLLDGGAISTATFNRNQAGNLSVQAQHIHISGNAMNPDGSLVQGTLNLPTIPFSSGLFASVDPGASGNGGTIDVHTETLALQNGGKIQTTTFGTGDAGTINITADQISVLGEDREGQFPSTISAGSGGIPDISRGNRRATGKGNDINLTTKTLLVGDRAAIAVGSLNRNPQKAKGAGNINISAETVVLNNGGRLLSDTASGDGGDITLTGYQNASRMRNLFLLNSGQISATAGRENVGGNGGNVSINADSILANLDTRMNAKGSDITANAFDGAGGNIRIRADRLLGILPRSAEEVNQTNDIDASSQLGTPGTIDIDANLVDPTQALVDLPVDIAVPQVARQCDRQIASAPSRLIDSGKGGVAKTPTAPNLANQPWEDLRLAYSGLKPSRRTTTNPRQGNDLPNIPLVEAQGFVRSPSGQFMLVAEVPRGLTRTANIPCYSPHF